jgi:hypothetical protein
VHPNRLEEMLSEPLAGTGHSWIVVRKR